MKEQLPAPDFDSNKYQRPNQKWNCGWLKDGKPCPHGPDGKGQCGAQPDCRPLLKPGAEGEKAAYICTRPKAMGGPCEEGPKLDGTCCHEARKCQPDLSLRHKRGLFTALVIALTFGALFFVIYGSWRWRYLSPGKLSVQHDSPAFHDKARKIGASDQCGTCHVAARGGPVGWVQASLAAKPAPYQFGELLKNFKPTETRIDSNCQQCHTHNHFHEPNVLWHYSCSACHEEHLGAKRLKQVDATHCLICHGDERIMESSSKKGEVVDAGLFAFQRDNTRDSFHVNRPKEGYTRTIHEFSDDHPEFQINRGGYKDPDSLRFSHATHSSQNATMPLLGGKALDCASCHQTGSDGVYFKPPTFEKNCRVCHELQVDPQFSDLTLPHGNPGAVRSFLRSMENQYADYAVKKKIAQSGSEVDTFVKGRISSMRTLYGSGEELEKKVFFSTERTGPATRTGGIAAAGRSLFPGCAYCHEVKATADLPLITRPIIPERWMSQGKFNHSRHTTVNCLTCHSQATMSKEAADIMLPSQKLCASCHNPRGAARNECTECHTFHHQPAIKIPVFKRDEDAVNIP
ncbi:MAG: hypothetical protein JWN25_1963 [Verrucomicrobiales bacterium]|nr:hypothetical protein [Verrucomicrobiales bacterium]